MRDRHLEIGLAVMLLFVLTGAVVGSALTIRLFGFDSWPIGATAGVIVGLMVGLLIALRR